MRLVNKRVPGHSLGESPSKQVPAKVRVIVLYSLDTITEVTVEPLNFSTAKAQLMKMLQQQGVIKRIECLSHICIQKCNRDTFPQYDSLVNKLSIHNWHKFISHIRIRPSTHPGVYRLDIDIIKYLCRNALLRISKNTRLMVD